MVAVNYAATTFLSKTLDIDFYLRYNNFTFQYAGIAQLVEQRIRNAQVACSSHVSSSRKPSFLKMALFFIAFMNLWCYNQKRNLQKGDNIDEK